MTGLLVTLLLLDGRLVVAMRRRKRRREMTLSLASPDGGADGSHVCVTVAPLPLRLHAPLAALVVPIQTRVAAAAT
ncbi:hypothetical protein BKA80DRAFT_264011 [Phyllosticta citrichinensis]